LQVRDAQAAIGPLFVGVAGTIAGLSPRSGAAPQYDLAAQIHSSDVASVLAQAEPRVAELVQGSIDADLRVRGAGSAASFAGSIHAPEGSVNGLSFRDLQGNVGGSSSAVSLTGVHVTVGSSPIALNAILAGKSGELSVSAPHLDLADFNDFFDAGDTFAGTGSLAASAALNGRRIVATQGRANFSNARFRRVALGQVEANWHSAGGAFVTALSFGGPTGKVALAGSIAPATRSVNLDAHVQNVDLATWLPMLGLDVPVTGQLNAQARLAGSYPNLAMQLHAAMSDGTAGRMPIERFEITASALGGRGMLESAVLDLPGLSTTGSGTFGFGANDPLALVLNSTSPNFGTFVDEATGKTSGVSGTLTSALHVEGTRSDPRMRDAIVLQSLRRGSLSIPRIAAEVDADRQRVALRNGEIDFAHGRLLASAAMPIRVDRRGPAPAPGPIAAVLTAADLQLSNFAVLLPKGTQLAGSINGRITAGGTLGVPLLSGALALRDGTFDGPVEKSPVTGVSADLTFSGSRARLQSHAFIGGGAITAQAVASLADLRRPADATFTVESRADNARFDLPDYFQGTLNGALTLVRAGPSAPRLSGDVSVYDARIPLSALLNQKGGGAGHSSFPNVAFDNLHITAGPNVRVQSANVDVGARGAMEVGGTLDAPSLSGSFASTGGSISFYRAFNIERGQVSFDPSGGVVPDVDAVATTFVANPATAVRLHVTGPVTNMNLALASDPPYDKQQILGLLVGAQQFGAVQGVASTGRPGISSGSALQGVALGQLNTAFTRNMLEPLSSSLAASLGFTNVQITSDIQTGLGVNAVKAFGNNVNAIFSQSFGYPRTQSIALEAQPNVATGLRLTAYTSEGPTLFALQQQPQPLAFGVLNLNPLTSFTPITGTNGVTFAYQKKFP
jgi:autotransporter translocation and assembly factor TamB